MRTTLFLALIGLTVIQRLIELRIARRNVDRLRAKGGVEFGADHYVLFIILHSLFFLSMIVEFLWRNTDLPMGWPMFLSIFLLAQASRLWVLRTMDGRWTTRVIAVRGERLINDGPFRYLPHPNYTIVAIELAALPLTFGLSATAIVFSALNAALILGVRLPVERRALQWTQEQ